MVPVVRKLIHIFLHRWWLLELSKEDNAKWIHLDRPVVPQYLHRCWLLELSKDHGAERIHLDRPVVPQFLFTRRRGSGLKLGSGWVVGKHGDLLFKGSCFGLRCVLELCSAVNDWEMAYWAGISSRGRVEHSGFPRIAGEPAAAVASPPPSWWLKPCAGGTSGIGSFENEGKKGQAHSHS